MSDEPMKSFPVGSVISADLTIPNTQEVLNFYQQVVGWTSEGLTMQDEDGVYEDYVVKDADGNWVGGVCHARGANLGLPPVWLIYVQVPDIDASLAHVVALGGEVVKKALQEDGSIQYAVIRDPAGAVMALTRAG